VSRRRAPLAQLAHVLEEVAFALASIFSRTLNATLFQGSMYQTLSARTYTEAHPPWLTPGLADASPRVAVWRQREATINALFFWQRRDHCRGARDADVLRARRALNRYGEGPDPDAESDEAPE